MAADVLSAALVAFVVSWWLGLEQIVPGLVLVLGCWRLWRRGDLRWPVELWPFLLLCIWSLTSMAALEGPSSWLIYVRGEAHLVVALCTYLVATTIDRESAAFGRFLKLCIGFVGLVLLMILSIVSGWLPLGFPAPIALLWPELTTGSAFVDGFLLERRLVTKAGVSLLPWIRRQSSFFLYQGGLTTALLVLQGWLLVARHRLAGRWRFLASAGVGVALFLALLTGSRSGLLLAWSVIAVLGFWSAIADKPWRRQAVRAVVGVALVAAVIAVIPVGDGSSLEHGALWEKALTNFRVNSFIDRVELYVETTDRISERPLTGWAIQGRPRETGPGERRRYLRLGTHSELLNVAYRFGWVGLALYLLAAGFYVFRLVSRSVDRPERPAIVVTIAALGVTALVRTFQWDLNVLWLVAALLGSSRSLPGPEARGRE